MLPFFVCDFYVMLRIISQSFTKVNSFLLHSHALNSPKTNFKNSVVYLLERLRWTAYRRSVIYMSKLPSSSLVRLVLTKNKLQNS